MGRLKTKTIARHSEYFREQVGHSIDLDRAFQGYEFLFTPVENIQGRACPAIDPDCIWSRITFDDVH